MLLWTSKQFVSNNIETFFERIYKNLPNYDVAIANHKIEKAKLVSNFFTTVRASDFV